MEGGKVHVYPRRLGACVLTDYLLSILDIFQFNLVAKEPMSKYGLLFSTMYLLFIVS